MKKTLPLILSVCFLHAAAAQQPNEMLKPSAGHQKMREWCGEWTITGKTYTTPLGPARDIKGKWIGRPILDGFAIEGTYLYDGYGPTGETQAKEIVSYDPVTNKYHYLFLSNNGYCEQAHFTAEGDVAAWEGTQVIGGKSYKFRGSDTDLSDSSGFVRRSELSADGTTWQPIMDCRHIRVKTTSDEQEMIRLAHVWLDAEVKQDAPTLARLWADDLTYCTSSGKVESKNEALATIRSGNLTITHSAYDSLDARIYGDMGVTTGVASQKGRYKDNEIGGKYRFTDTWIKRDGRWQCVATHASKIAEAGGESGLSTREAAKALEGLWSMQEQRIDGSPSDMKNKRGLKVYQDGTFLFVNYDASTGKIEMAGGGDYTFDGKTLEETARFVNDDDWLQYLPISFVDSVRFEEETFHQSGTRLGAMLEQVWRRVTPK